VKKCDESGTHKTFLKFAYISQNLKNYIRLKLQQSYINRKYLHHMKSKQVLNWFNQFDM